MTNNGGSRWKKHKYCSAECHSADHRSADVFRTAPVITTTHSDPSLLSGDRRAAPATKTLAVICHPDTALMSSTRREPSIKGLKRDLRKPQQCRVARRRLLLHRHPPTGEKRRQDGDFTPAGGKECKLLVPTQKVGDSNLSED